MDTRIKIQAPERAAEAAAALRAGGRRLRLAAGTFDVLLAAHAAELGQLAAGAALAVAVLNPPNPVLSLRARAEMVAALACVGCVFPVEDELDAVIAALRPDEVVRLCSAHRERLAQLIRHVHARHGR